MRYLRHPFLEVSALCSFFCLTAACQNGRSQSGSAVSNEVVQGFQNLENTWSQAVDHRDQYALELVLAPDFLNVGIDGRIASRDLEIAQLLHNHESLPSLRQRVVILRDYGDITIVVGTFIEGSRTDSRQPNMTVYLRTCINRCAESGDAYVHTGLPCNLLLQLEIVGRRKRMISSRSIFERHRRIMARHRYLN